MNSQGTDVVVIGGGVAGLSAAISFTRMGLEVLLLEKNNEFGKRIKGEVIYKSAEVFKQVFGAEGLPKSMRKIVFETAKYYTPSTKKWANRVFPLGEKIGIEYRELIDELVIVASKEGVDLRLNAKVASLLEKNGKISGLKYHEFGRTEEIFPKLIISSVGLHSSLALPKELKTPKHICPAIKSVVGNLNLPNPNELEFFLLELPAVIWIFPKSKSRAELGITVWTSHLADQSRPNLNFLLENAIKTHPILKERLREGKYIYYVNELLAFGGPLTQIFIPNVFFIGDAVGHVGAVGGSGIESSMSIGYQLGQELGAILKTKSDLTLEDFQQAQRSVNKSPIGKELKKEQSSANIMRKILYEPKKTPEEIDELWDKFKNFIESRGA